MDTTVKIQATFILYRDVTEYLYQNVSDTKHPFPENSDRAIAYGDSLDKIEELNKVLDDN